MAPKDRTRGVLVVGVVHKNPPLGGNRNIY
jgi:hypothetical protein